MQDFLQKNNRALVAKTFLSDFFLIEYIPIRRGRNNRALAAKKALS